MSGTFGLRDPGNWSLASVAGGCEAEQALLMGGHRGGEPEREQAFHMIPVDPHPTMTVVANLVVGSDLTGHGHPTRAFTGQTAVPAETPLDAESRSEDRRGTGFVTDAPGQP